MSNIKEARKRLKGVTCTRASKWFGINYRTMDSWENERKRIPKDQEKRLLDAYEALTIFGPEFYESLDEGDSTIEQAIKSYKIYAVQQKARIGSFETAFNYQWSLIPPGVKEKCSVEELAILVDALYDQYRNGQNSEE